MPPSPQICIIVASEEKKAFSDFLPIKSIRACSRHFKSDEFFPRKSETQYLALKQTSVPSPHLLEVSKAIRAIFTGVAGIALATPLFWAFNKSMFLSFLLF